MTIGTRPARAGNSLRVGKAASAPNGRPTSRTEIRPGAQVAVTVRQDSHVWAQVAAIADDAWTLVGHADAIFDQDSGHWISCAEVAP